MGACLHPAEAVKLYEADRANYKTATYRVVGDALPSEFVDLLDPHGNFLFVGAVYISLS